MAQGMSVRRLRMNRKTGKITRGKSRRVKVKKITEEDFFGDMDPTSEKLKVDLRKKKRNVGRYGKRIKAK